MIYLWCIITGIARNISGCYRPYHFNNGAIINEEKTTARTLDPVIIMASLLSVNDTATGYESGNLVDRIIQTYNSNYVECSSMSIFVLIFDIFRIILSVVSHK